MPNLARVLRPVVGVVVALAVAEVVALGVHSSRYVYDPERGYVMGPGVVRNGEEGFGTSVWLEGGVRRPRPWSFDEPRITVLGDSFTEALTIDDADVFTQRLEGILRDRGMRVQVLNLGRSTESAADYVALAPVFARRFLPTWSIVEVRSADFEDDAWNEGKTHFARAAEGHLVVERVVQAERTGLSGRVFRARQRSLALGWAGTRLGELRGAMNREPPLFAAGRGPEPVPVSKDYPIEEEVDAVVQAFDGRVTLLVVPAFEADAPNTPERTETRVLTRCRDLGASCVTVRDRYAALAERGVAPFGFASTWYNTGHANALAHQLFADALATTLSARPDDLLGPRHGR
jgi:hypothetical protein